MRKESPREAASRLRDRVFQWVGQAQFRHSLLRRLVEGAQKVLPPEMRIRSGRGAGMRIRRAHANPGYILGTTEPVVQDFIADNLSRGDVFYDVGANVGFFTLIGARAVGPEGRVYALEPLPENVRALVRNISANGIEHVHVVQAAVAAEPRTGTLLVGSAQNSRLGQPGERTDRGTLTVRTVSLDALVRDHGFPAPTLVKIDAEGAERAVLQGMAWLLCQKRPRVVCEIHEQTTHLETVRLMASAVAGTQPGARYEIQAEAGEVWGVIPELAYRIYLLEKVGPTDEIWVGHAVAVPDEGAPS